MGLVVVYHLFPDVVAAGFVGVDVFFVISGYLITGHLVREMDSRGAIDLLGFYARRARRLVPAATVVLVLTWLASLLFLPSSRLAATAQQVTSSALYVQNWLLARDSVDYLTAEDAASPVQHYWSLSVEEQFYLGWPLLLIAAGFLARLLQWRWHRVALLLGGVGCGLSLVASVVLTSSDGPSAYFVTHTRVWELGAGALLAVLAGRLNVTRAVAPTARWFGLILIGAPAMLYSSATPFPGVAALVPVAGTLLVLVSGAAVPESRLLEARPMVWLGDHSYALYLVHWPLIVFWKAWSGGDIGALDGPAILVVSVVMAWALTRYVEDPLRRSRALASRGRGLAVAMAAALPVAMVAPQLMSSPAPAREVSATNPGAAVLAGDSAAVADSVDTMVPRPEDAIADRPGYYEQGCEVPITSAGTVRCEFGEPDGAIRVALVGDSKAGQWLPSLEALASEHDWHITTYLRSRCPWSATLTTVGAGDASPYLSCRDWGQDVLERLRADAPDLLFTTDRPVVGTPDHPRPDTTSYAEIARGMTTYWEKMSAAGTRVVAIRETPEMGTNVPDCISAPGGTIAGCSADAATALADSPPAVAATRALHGKVPLVDLTRFLCREGTCPPVIGNVLVYRDAHHLTRTFSVSLAPYLEEDLMAAGVLD